MTHFGVGVSRSTCKCSASKGEGDLSASSGGYLDLHTGEVIDEAVTDPMMVGEDVAVDVDEDPDRWLRFDRTGSRDGWQDMAASPRGNTTPCSARDCNKRSALRRR